MFSPDQVDQMLAVMRGDKQNCSHVDTLIENEYSLRSLRDFCVIVRSMLRPQSYGAKLERLLVKRFGLGCKLNKASGDTVSQKIGTIEIKISLGTRDNQYCLAQQVRPFHDVDFYLCMYYNIIDDAVSLHLVPAQEMVRICKTHGGSSHSKMNSDNQLQEWGVFGSKFADTATKQSKAWKEIQQYEKSEEELLQLL